MGRFYIFTRASIVLIPVWVVSHVLSLRRISDGDVVRSVAPARNPIVGTDIQGSERSRTGKFHVCTYFWVKLTLIFMKPRRRWQSCSEVLRSIRSWGSSSPEAKSASAQVARRARKCLRSEGRCHTRCSVSQRSCYRRAGKSRFPLPVGPSLPESGYAGPSQARDGHGRKSPNCGAREASGAVIGKTAVAAFASAIALRSGKRLARVR